MIPQGIKGSGGAVFRRLLDGLVRDGNDGVSAHHRTRKGVGLAHVTSLWIRAKLGLGLRAEPMRDLDAKIIIK